MSKEAIIFIDVQNDFITDALRNESAIKVYPNILNFVQNIDNSKNYSYFATRDTHNEDYLTNTLEGKNLPIKHCIENTKGWEIADELNKFLIEKNSIFVNKPTFGSFKLIDAILQEETKTGEVFDTITLMGFCTSICVLANAVLLRAAFPDTNIVVKSDCCACVTPESHDAALTVLKMQQIVVE